MRPIPFTQLRFYRPIFLTRELRYYRSCVYGRLRPDTKHSRTHIGISQDAETQRPTSIAALLSQQCVTT
jgi:hypothetical protein